MAERVSHQTEPDVREQASEDEREGYDSFTGWYHAYLLGKNMMALHEAGGRYPMMATEATAAQRRRQSPQRGT